MLILTRRASEKILIGDNIEVVICGTNLGQVKVGIQAPGHIKVLRSELIGRKEKSKTIIKVKKSRLKA